MASELSPSKTVRALLDERGIEWQSGAFGDPRITYWNSNGVEWCAIEHVDGRLVVNMGIDITPEQAIAATVGTRTDLSKRLRKVHGLHDFAELFGFSWEDGSDWSWHDVACTMADAVDQQDEVERLKAENAKLRAECDEWHRVAVSKQDVIDHMRDARDENERLRELVREMYATISDRNSWWDCTCKDTTRFSERMREFGIEVG